MSKHLNAGSTAAAHKQRYRLVAKEDQADLETSEEAPQYGVIWCLEALEMNRRW